MVKSLIMAGGAGERLWPLSSSKKPKQFHAFGTEKSMVEETLDRLGDLVDEMYVVLTEEQYQLFIYYLPDFPKENIIVEPVGRNTAPAIAVGSLKFDDDDIMVVLPSDHVIRNIEEFHKTLRTAINEARKEDVLITIGITPSYPHTGYGYLERGEKWSQKSNSYKVRRFHEKPDFEQAQAYFKTGGYYWNSGMFVWRKKVFEQALAVNLAPVYKCMLQIEDDPESLNTVYEKMPGVSIDYGVMEKADNVVVIPASFYWNDIGSWDSVYDLEDKDKRGNVVKGRFILNQVRNSLLINVSDRIVGLSMLENVIVISSDNGTLICARGESQTTKEIVRDLG
jgi:mannose-1-phosphate guanylyltransferase